MSLGAGTRLGPYEITGPIGAGGMGEVYRARDTKLNRDVALKILPQRFAGDPDRLSRFRREAHVLASLNHSNIAAIYGLEEAHAPALVLEFVEGPTLADRIARQPIPPEESLSIARQIADALETAHAQGIVHRDLKPSNVKVRPDGAVKVLDFGLAKALEVDPHAADASMSPTMTSPVMTLSGVILGTAAYMSPEQARGALVDSRTDVWSFGVVLYEMLAGRTLFEGATVSDTLAAVLRADVDWNRLPSSLHPSLRRLLERCLERDVKRRLQHIGDARIEIEDLLSRRHVGAIEPKTSSRWGATIGAALLFAAVVGTSVWQLKPARLATGQTTSFVIRTPNDTPVSGGGGQFPLALSPDGRHLVYGIGLAGKDPRADVARLVHQDLGDFDPVSLPGTVGAAAPFFSPDGGALGFYSFPAGELQQVRLSGGTPTRLYKTPGTEGVSWATNGTLVFGVDWGFPLQIVRRATQESVALTRLDVATGEGAHLWPQILPGNKAVLFTIWMKAPSWDESRIAVADIETGRHTVVLSGGAFGRYAASGHLVFWRGNALMAAPFDVSALKVTGEPVKVVQDVRLAIGNGGAHFAISDSGTLAYVKGGADAFAETFVVERSGKQLVRLDDSQPVGAPSFSPDGKRVSVDLLRGGIFGIGVFDMGRRLMTPLPLTGDNAASTWTPDGSRVTFQSNVAGTYDAYSMPFDGSGAPEPLMTGNVGFSSSTSAWTPDGRQFAFVKAGEKTGSDIWILTPGQAGAKKPLIATAANESWPRFSPDGHFIAYQSDESGAVEVYVRPFPRVEGGRQLVSEHGGRAPRWSRDGKELLYVTEKGIMTVPILARSESASLVFGQPSLALAVTGLTSFDISPDGRTFAIERVPIEKAAREIHVVLNWFTELQQRVPTR